MSALRESDYANFAKLGVNHPEPTAERVTDAEAREKYGIKYNGNLDGIIIHYISPVTGKPVTNRLRRDFPPIKDGKPEDKYISAYGDRRHLFFPPNCAPLLPDVAVPVVIVEAEKSVLALVEHAQRTKRACLPVATGGCWSFRGRIGITENAKGQRVEEKGILPDFELIKWQDRRTIICYDSDTATNPKVRAARWALALELTARGAVVHFSTLPQVENCSGPDDIVGLCGDEVLTAILDGATLFPEAARAEVNTVLEAIEAAFPTVTSEEIKTLYATLALIEDNDTRSLLVSRAAKSLRGTISKADVVAGVKRQRGALAKECTEIEEQARVAAVAKIAIDPASLVQSLETFFAERIFLPAGAARLLAFFVMLTWTFELFDTTPYLSVESAVQECGKSSLLQLLHCVCARAEKSSSITEAVLFRLVAAFHPTFLLDEAETIEARNERAEAIRAISHEGYKRGGSVARIAGEDRHVEHFDVYCPKVFSAIGGITGPLLSRCIVIHMVRAPKYFIRKPMRLRAISRDAEPLRKMLESYSLQFESRLAELYAAAPDEGYWPGITDREAELWEPLLIHARIAGPDIEAKLLEAFQVFTKGKRSIQADDWQIARTIALCNAVRDQMGDRFIPGDLVESLQDAEAWASTFAKLKDDKTKAVKVGRFLQTFRLQRIRGERGSSYSRAEVLAALTSHIPEGSDDTGAPAFDYRPRTADQVRRRVEQDEELSAAELPERRVRWTLPAAEVQP